MQIDSGSFYSISEFRKVFHLNVKFFACYIATRDEERMELEIIAEENERNGEEENEEMAEEDELVIMDPKIQQSILDQN